MVADEALHAYVSQLTARLSRFAQSRFPLTIEIHEDPEGAKPDATGLPGGYLFVSRRFLLLKELDEAGFASPVAHAIAHMLIPISFRKFHERREAEADRLVAEWMTQSGLAGDGTTESGEFAAMGERA